MIISVTDAECGIGRAFLSEAERRGHEVSDDTHIDMNDPAALREHYNALRPDAVVHCRTDTRRDVTLTENISRVCRAVGTRMMLVSSAEIYGSSGEFSESSPMQPQSTYGKKRLSCERRFAEICRTGYILRLPEMIFGQGGDMDIVEAILSEGAVSSEFTADHSVERCAVYAPDAAELGIDIIESGRTGVYNCANEGRFTMFAFTCETFRLARLAGHADYYDITVNPSEEGGDSILLRCENILAAGIEPLDDWHTALERCIASKKIT